MDNGAYFESTCDISKGIILSKSVTDEFYF